jgi:hypothetical protein
VPELFRLDENHLLIHRGHVVNKIGYHLNLTFVAEKQHCSHVLE